MKDGVAESDDQRDAGIRARALRTRSLGCRFRL